MIPIKAVSGHRVYRTFASVGSLEADVASHGNDAPPGVSTPNNSRRWDNLSNCYGFYLSNQLQWFSFNDNGDLM